MNCKESICRNCFHSYVCEQFNENKDDNNEKCHFFNDHYVPAADVVLKNEWISVEDRLPENKVNCIVYYKHAYCDNDGYWAIGVSFYDGNEFQIGLAYKVTHWMPIPAPPTKKEN